MDTSGNFYGSPEAQEEIGKILGKLGAEKMRPIEEMPAGSISIESEAVARWRMLPRSARSLTRADSASASAAVACMPSWPASHADA